MGSTPDEPDRPQPNSPKRYVRKSSRSPYKEFKGQHRFEHWYVSNQVYFITARCRDKYPAFASEQAKAIFWDRFEHYTSEARFFPWIVSLMNNHYHVVGYAREGELLGRMIQRLHGSTAKLVNDLLPARLTPFWSEPGHQDYFDGCIRDEKQCRRAYKYVLTQSVRHRICGDWRDYPHTRVCLQLEPALKRALELKAFLEGVPYRRYEKGQRRGSR
jgi:REP element-mobilizing transposase RayT